MKQLTLFLSMLLALSVNAQVTVTPSASSICPGEIVTFSVTPNDTLGTYTYLWSPMLPDSNVVQVAPPTTNSWTVTVLIDSSGVFVGNGSVMVTVNQIPTTTASNTGPYCDGSTISLSASGGTSYDWTGPGGWTATGANPTRPATLASAGMYYVSITDGNGCQATDSTMVTVDPLPTPFISASADSVCVGSPVTLFAGGGVSYNWSTGDIGATISDTPGFTTTYTVTVTDGNGCQATDSTMVTVVSNPIIIGTGGSDVSCWGGSDGTVSTGVTLSSLPVNYLWSTGDTTQFVSGLSAGTYTVTVSNVFGCTDTTSRTVGQPPLLQVDSLIITDASCNGFSDGSIGVNGSGGLGSYSYDWSDGGVGNPRSNLTAGTYTVTVTDGNGCTTSATGTIWEPQALTANANSNSVSCFGGSNGIAVVAIVGGTSPYSYQWSTGATGDTLNNLFPGVYTVNVTDGNGCQTGDTVTVNEPAQLNLSFTPTSVSCNGGSNGSIDLDVVGGTTPYSYSWSNGFLGEDPSGLIAGTYTVTVTDANGCDIIDSVSVGQPAVLSLTTTSSPATCVSLGSASVSVSGGTLPYSYSWNNGDTTPVSTAPTGTYSVVVTDANNCTASAVQSIGITAPAVVTGTESNVSCWSGSDGAINLTVSGTGPFTYTWSNGDTTQNISGLSAGTYSVTVTDGNGCTTSASWTINQPSNPLTTVVIGSDPDCANSNDGSVNSSTAGGTSPYSYNWNTGQTSANINNLGGGTYILTVTDANGCTASDTSVLVAPTQLTFTSNISAVSCFGESDGSIDLNVSGGTPPYSYNWSNGYTGQDPSGLAAGNYFVTITDANGCSVTSPSWSVTQPNAPVFVTVSTINEITCNGDTDGSLQANVSGGSGPYTWAWVGGGNTQTLSSLGAGTYQVTVMDANGCSNTSSSTLTNPPVLVLDAGNSWNFCANSGEYFEATATGGAPYTGGGYTWLWNDGINTPFHLAPASAGSYNYSVTVTDQNGCQATDATVVNVSTEEAPFAGINLSQTGPAEWVFSSATVQPGWTYSWDFGDGYQSTLPIPSVTHEYSNTGAYLVTLTVTNSCGSSTAQWTINVTMTTSIGEVSDKNVRMYPNPVNQYSSISVDGLNGEEVDVTIFDVVGKIVYNTTHNESILRIPANWPAGVYHLQLRQGNQTLTKKLIVQ